MASPDFLGIGAPRAGTSWLYHNLKWHTQVWMPPVKEIHYFDSPAGLPLIFSLSDPKVYTTRIVVLQALLHPKPFQKPYRRWYLCYLFLPHTTGWYKSLFSPEIGQICGDITPNYACLARNQVVKIHNLLPDARIIYILRNPITQLWSHTAMHFKLWWNLELERVGETRIKQYLNRKRGSDVTNYLQNLDTWRSFYPDNQIFVGFFENLVEDPWAFFQDICIFLGIDASKVPSSSNLDKKWNAEKYPPIPESLSSQLAVDYLPLISEIHKRFDNIYTKSWLVSAQQQSFHPEEDHVLSNL